ncbi:MAG TPA: HAMP domain-containing sensor histidine kinase [Ktedonobacteraceae bacterium]|nr:HAMP domain-containing sensor histidine kinase [Ktedonobacteraceae bacterium]
MRILNALSRLLFNLPYLIRLGMVALLFLICLILLIFGFPSPYDGSLFAVPVALAAWLFKYRGALLCICGTLLVIGIIYPARANGLGPHSLITVFIIGAVALMTEGFVIAYLRQALDLVQAAQLKAQQAQQAQQQATIAYEQQRHLNQMKDQFLIHVSHELRTPLQAVLGYLELLRDFNGQLDATMRTSSLNNAVLACENLQLLVNNVLDAVRISGNGQLPKVEDLSVIEVVQDVLAHVESQKQNYSFHLDIPGDLMVVADPQQIRQVLLSLLTNIFKYCPMSSSVIISAALSDAAGQESGSPSHVCICVKDSGPGIPPEEIPLLFEKFVRLKRDLSGTVRGTGLGLYISKLLVQAMGGRMWAESSGISGEGSRFCFTLPCATGTMS